MENKENFFGQRIKEIRTKNKLSQEEFAFQIDVSRQTVYFWETGKVVPDSGKLLTICQKFGIDANELLFDKGEQIGANECCVDLAEDTYDGKSQSADDKKKTSESNLKKYKLIISIGIATIFICLLLIGIFSFNTPSEDSLAQVSVSDWNITFGFVLYIFTIILLTVIISCVAGYIFYKKGSAIQQKTNIKESD